MRNPSRIGDLCYSLLDELDVGTRSGLRETPGRFAKAMLHHTSGYEVDIGALLKTFDDGAEAYDEMVALLDIPVYRRCEHHLEAIFGTATVAYIPNGRIVGLSKINRLVDAFARRLQVQERMTQQIAHALMEHLSPLGAACRIRARHLCMESRGVCQQGHHTVTTCLLGAFREKAAARSEFLSL